MRVTHPPCLGRLQSRTPLSNDHSFRKSFVALYKHCICQEAWSTWLQPRPENPTAAGSRSLCLGPRAVGWDSWHPWLTRTNPIPPEWDFAMVKSLWGLAGRELLPLPQRDFSPFIHWVWKATPHSTRTLNKLPPPPAPPYNSRGKQHMLTSTHPLVNLFSQCKLCCCSGTTLNISTVLLHQLLTSKLCNSALPTPRKAVLVLLSFKWAALLRGAQWLCFLKTPDLKGTRLIPGATTNHPWSPQAARLCPKDLLYQFFHQFH